MSSTSNVGDYSHAYLLNPSRNRAKQTPIDAKGVTPSTPQTSSPLPPPLPMTHTHMSLFTHVFIDMDPSFVSQGHSLLRRTILANRPMYFPGTMPKPCP
ncbi:unnamed protein product [Periconia digitata]|uniref:Uncharacterized protein n=1 Tax=Periconia digitata TaxID=1303443 RepID=A0A9W4XK80_9PLEO|nr:unnamed protein product [Periconia digitata]